MPVGSIFETTNTIFSLPFIIGTGLIAVAIISYFLFKIGNINEGLQKYLEMFSLVVSIIGIVIDLQCIFPNSNVTATDNNPYVASSVEQTSETYYNENTTQSAALPTTTGTQRTNTSSPFAYVTEGGTVTYGYYNGEKIEWEVLEVNGNEALVFSKYNIEQMIFNETAPVTWKNSSLRSWLNNNFISDAFSSEDTSFIIESTLITHVPWSTDETTYDRIFPLSRSELDKYFSSNYDRRTTTFSLAHSKSNCDQYWLRDSGVSGTRVLIVKTDGSIRKEGSPVQNAYVNVRPAMWVRMK